MNWRQLFRELKCAFRGHRPEGGYVSDNQRLCGRCGLVVFVEPRPAPRPEPEPNKPPVEPPPAFTGEHIVKKIAHWFGPNLSSASVDNRFELSVSNSGRDWSPAPSDWRSAAAGTGCPSDCNVMCCAAYKRADGLWVGGKYDWNRPRPSPRDWTNVANGYNGWQAPASGTEMICWCYTADGNRVSLEAKTTYR